MSGEQAEQTPDDTSAGGIGEQLRVIETLGAAFRSHLGDRLSVNDTDLGVMSHLMLEGPQSPTELARRGRISTAATTVAIDRLVRVGHVRREPHPSDRRRVVIVPHEDSVRRAFEALDPVVRGVADAAAALDPEQRAVVSRFLDSVIGVYRGALPEAVDGRA